MSKEVFTANSIIHGPKMAWYYQFRHSCKGFETRVRMDGRECHFLSDNSFVDRDNRADILSNGTEGPYQTNSDI